MANENNKINELVSEDDDPTEELEVPVLRAGRFVERESDAKTFDVERKRKAATEIPVAELESDLRSRDQTIDRLQFDIEQLHAKWLGLEAEINARESQTSALNEEIQSLQATIERKEKLLRKRDARIRSLKKEIRQRDEQHRDLKDDFEQLQLSIQTAAQEAEEQRYVDDAGLASLTGKELVEKLQNAETYADTLRQQLQDVLESLSSAEQQRDSLQSALNETKSDCEKLSEELDKVRDDNQALTDKLGNIESRHADEIRNLRFELGEAQDSIVQSEEVNTQLASDLVEAASTKEALEQKLAETEEKTGAELNTLNKDLRKLAREAEGYEQKLATKNEAISVLLAELAKKAEQLESIGDIEDVIHDIDDRISERMDPPNRQPVDRMTRLLVGTIDGQLLRFPLFKDRLTIGRTEDNDIQLKAAYISRRHAVIKTDQEVTRIIDWGSKNGVFVNSEQVKEHFLNHGDMVTIGNARFRYEERKKRDT